MLLQLRSISVIWLLTISYALCSPTAVLRNGTYEGYHLPSKGQDIFLGIPYAQPPIGNLRFQAPQPLNSTWKHIRNATNYGPVCMQYTSTPTYASMSEDCLSLNVIRPKQARFQNLPVAVWIHGGGLYSGGSADPSTNLTNFVYQSTLAGKPIVAISLNYRLSAFGFLSGSPEVSKNGNLNNGLYDQRLALHWIQENIEAFGGDPTKVTIWGESSGALSVGKHLTAYRGRDDKLFRGAIMESGGMVEKWPYNIANASAYSEDLYRNLTTTTNCANQTSPLDCLRALPLDRLSRALNYSDTPVYAGTGLGPWLTVVDGVFLQDGPSESLRKGHFNHNVAIMYTTLTDEASVFMSTGPINNDDEFASLIASAGPDSETIKILEMLYPNVNALGLPAGYHPTPADDAVRGSQYKRAVAFLTDAVETSSRRMTLDTWAKANATAYSARLDLIPLGTPSFLGASHSTELAFVFNNIQSVAYADPQMIATSELMSRSWASFVHDLNPNRNGVACAPTWPKWQINNSEGVGSNLVFTATGNNSLKSHVELDSYRLAQTRYINSLWSTQLNY